jgi:hypothetical protein
MLDDVVVVDTVVDELVVVPVELDGPVVDA